MSAKEDKHCGIFDGSIAYGLTDKWPSEDKRKFIEGWPDDSSFFILMKFQKYQAFKLNLKNYCLSCKIIPTEFVQLKLAPNLGGRSQSQVRTTCTTYQY